MGGLSELAVLFGGGRGEKEGRFSFWSRFSSVAREARLLSVPRRAPFGALAAFGTL